MKEAEYFQKASQDADYRREKIEELRDFSKVTLGLLIGFGALEAAYILYVAIAERRWPLTFDGMLGSIILMAWMHTNNKTRLAALKVMDGKQPVCTPSASGNLPA